MHDYQDQAEEALRAKLFSGVKQSAESFGQPNIDTTLELFVDDAADAFGSDWNALREAACGMDTMEKGRLLERALERAAQRYINSAVGQSKISDMAADLEAEDDHILYGQHVDAQIHERKEARA